MKRVPRAFQYCSHTNRLRERETKRKIHINKFSRCELFWYSRLTSSFILVWMIVVPGSLRAFLSFLIVRLYNKRNHNTKQGNAPPNELHWWIRCVLCIGLLSYSQCRCLFILLFIAPANPSCIPFNTNCYWHNELKSKRRLFASELIRI